MSDPVAVTQDRQQPDLDRDLDGDGQAGTKEKDMGKVLVDDLLGYRFLSNVRFAPDGKRVAVIVKQASAEQNLYESDLHLVCVEDGDVRQLTTRGRVGTLAWSQDGARLAYFSQDTECSNSGHICELSLSCEKVEQILALPYVPKDLSYFAGDSLLYTARVQLGEQSKEEDTVGVEVLDELPFWENGEGITNQRRVRLFLHRAGAREPQALTDEELNVKAFDVCGNRIVVLARRRSGMSPQTDELWLFDESCPPRCISCWEFAFDAVRFLDAQSVIAAGTDMKTYGRGENRQLLRFDLAGVGPVSLTPHWDCSVGSSVVGDCRHGTGPELVVDNRSAYVAVTDRSVSYVMEVSPTGECRQVTAPRGSVDSFDVHKGTVVAVELLADRLQELYVYRQGTPQQLTCLNQAGLANRDVSLPERFYVRASDGTELDAWLIRPVDQDPDSLCPVVLSIHGGPRTAFGEVFNHEMQVLAGKGFAVLYTNPRGSSGRGNEFAELRGKYGTVDYDDLMVALDEALQRYKFLDSERMGVMGGSYGGFMTNWIIGHTDRFRAAVSQRSISNWISEFCTSDIGYLFNCDQLATTPWQEGGAEDMWVRSPLRYADRVRTPTLLIHADADYRCWFGEGLQMLTALRYHGVVARMVLFKDENHELSRSGRPRPRLRRLREIVSWLESHLR